MKKNKTEKLYLTRDKHLLNIYSPKFKRTVRYNLKTRQMQREKKGEWYNVENQYDFFRPYNIDSIMVRDKHFKTMLLESVKANHTCTSVSSFISRFANALVYENFITQGVKYQVSGANSYYRRWNTPNRLKHFQHSLEEYDNETIRFFKENDYTVTNKFEEFYFNNPKKALITINAVWQIDMSFEDRKNVLNEIMQSQDFYPLVDEYNYDIKSLINFVVNYLKPFEDLRYTESFRLLRDYYSMANTIGRNVKRYPKYLKSIHDIITVNHNAFKQEYDEIKFKQIAKLDLEHKGAKFCIKVPVASKEIIKEGTSLNHCVGNYIERILAGKAYIFFLRDKKKPASSLVTLELIENKMTQAKGAYNRPIVKEEKTFLQSYCKSKNLLFAVG